MPKTKHRNVISGKQWEFKLPSSEPTVENHGTDNTSILNRIFKDPKNRFSQEARNLVDKFNRYPTEDKKSIANAYLKAIENDTRKYGLSGFSTEERCFDAAITAVREHETRLKEQATTDLIEEMRQLLSDENQASFDKLRENKKINLAEQYKKEIARLENTTNQKPSSRKRARIANNIITPPPKTSPTKPPIFNPRQPAPFDGGSTTASESDNTTNSSSGSTYSSPATSPSYQSGRKKLGEAESKPDYRQRTIGKEKSPNTPHFDEETQKEGERLFNKPTSNFLNSDNNDGDGGNNFEQRTRSTSFMIHPDNFTAHEETDDELEEAAPLTATQSHQPEKVNQEALKKNASLPKPTSSHSNKVSFGREPEDTERLEKITLSALKALLNHMGPHRSLSTLFYYQNGKGKISSAINSHQQQTDDVIMTSIQNIAKEKTVKSCFRSKQTHQLYQLLAEKLDNYYDNNGTEQTEDYKQTVLTNILSHCVKEMAKFHYCDSIMQEAFGEARETLKDARNSRTDWAHAAINSTKLREDTKRSLIKSFTEERANANTWPRYLSRCSLFGGYGVEKTKQRYQEIAQYIQGLKLK